MSKTKVFLLNYKVMGIKSLDQEVELSFAPKAKTITRKFNPCGYNMKGIYGMNGAGKSGIVFSIRLLKNLVLNREYLNNPIVQNTFEKMINKKLGFLNIEAEYLVENSEMFHRVKYVIRIERNNDSKYVIKSEELTYRKASSRMEKMNTVFSVQDGEIIQLLDNCKSASDLVADIVDTTKNLLISASMPALAAKQLLTYWIRRNLPDIEYRIMLSIVIFAMSLHSYLDDSDDYAWSVAKEDIIKGLSDYEECVDNVLDLNEWRLEILNPSNNKVDKKSFDEFQKDIKKLCGFIKIFKYDLKEICIEKTEDADYFYCDLIMVYNDYRIGAEFESTGIKKLIKLYSYFGKMVAGDIVFIDELDSNLHDVYLCALLEYLVEYGEGQLCFTTHNVGPMDVLKKRNKSIDFLSIDHRIYSWVNSGNYSPSKLYRKGMIEGSPFNIDSMDFIGIFDMDEEVEDE